MAIQNPENRASRPIADPNTALWTPGFSQFFKTHEKVRWNVGDLDWTKMRPDLLTQPEVNKLRLAMMVESHNPVFTSVILNYFKEDHEMAAFTVVWSYEEMKHYGVLRTYLEALEPTGMVDREELSEELDEVRKGSWGEKESQFTLAQTFVYPTIQELFTARFYEVFAASTKEPLLYDILRLVAKDERRHQAYYFQKAKEIIGNDKDRKNEVDKMLLEFEMPGFTFLGRDRYERYRGENNLVDVETMKQFAGVLKGLLGFTHVLGLATQRPYQEKLKHSAGFDLSKVNVLSLL